MSEDEKIHVDVSRPATLHNGAVSTDFPTLKDAIMAWNRLRPEQARRASIRIIGWAALLGSGTTKASQWGEVPQRVVRPRAFVR
jgi:hypothetical protein